MTISQSGTGQPAFQLTFVYAKCSIQERQVLWRSLLAMHSTLTGPWLVAGDFNCIMATDEKLGGNPPSLAAMSDFIDCSSDCGLIDAGYLGSKYTWHNNRSGSNGIWARLAGFWSILNGKTLFQYLLSIYPEKLRTMHHY